MKDDSFFFYAQSSVIGKFNICMKSFTERTFPSTLMVLTSFPPRIFALRDTDHTCRG